MGQFLLALCGIPASGKTKLAEAIVAQSDERAMLVSTDQWRDMAYYADFTPEREGEVRKAALESVTKHITEGHSVVHDDTNYYASMRHELYEIARNLGCVFAVVHVSTPLDEALKWNLTREVRIPEDVVRRISERIDIPGTKYAWDRPIATINLRVQNVDDAARIIVERLTTLEVPSTIEGHTDGQMVNDLLDTITRQVVSAFLKEHPECQNDSKVSRIRRDLLKEAVARNMSAYDTEQLLRVRLGSLVKRVLK